MKLKLRGLGNGMSMALTVAIYFLTCRELGQIPMFPGNKFFYNAVDDASYAPSIADMSVWASTNEHTKNEAFSRQYHSSPATLPRSLFFRLFQNVSLWDP